MRRLAGEVDEEALVADRPRDRGGEPAGVQQDRALLDVQLEVGQRAVEPRGGGARAVEVDVVLGQRVLESHARRVEQVADLVGVERPGDGRRAQQRAPEARALLVGPVDERAPTPAAASRRRPARAACRAR